MTRRIFAITLAGLLSACGGGAGGGDSGNGTPVALADPGAATVGDFYSRKGTGFYTDATGFRSVSDPYLETTVTRAADATGSVQEASIVYDGTGFDRVERTYSPYGSWLTGHQGTCDARNLSPEYGPPRKLGITTSWDTAATSTVQCANSPLRTYQDSQKGAVIATESITVAAGTFETYKLTYVMVRKTDTYTKTSNVTEWRDVITGAGIKSITTGKTVFVTNVQSNYTYEASSELQGFSHARTARQRLNVERFAGPWSGNYVGASSGTCHGQISPQGSLDAACGGGAFMVHGQIDASGKVDFALNAGGQSGPVFSGKFDAPLKIEGLWTNGAGGSGTWNLNHL
jgi:hypothetical protein